MNKSHMSEIVVGAAFLPTLAPLVGLPALDPDPFWD